MYGLLFHGHLGACLKLEVCWAFSCKVSFRFIPIQAHRFEKSFKPTDGLKRYLRQKRFFWIGELRTWLTWNWQIYQSIMYEISTTTRISQSLMKYFTICNYFLVLSQESQENDKRCLRANMYSYVRTRTLSLRN